MYGNMFDGLASLFKIMFVILCLSVPLGLWKLIEILVWVFSCIEIGIK